MCLRRTESAAQKKIWGSRPAAAHMPRCRVTHLHATLGQVECAVAAHRLRPAESLRHQRLRLEAATAPVERDQRKLVGSP